MSGMEKTMLLVVRAEPGCSVLGIRIGIGLMLGVDWILEVGDCGPGLGEFKIELEDTPGLGNVVVDFAGLIGGTGTLAVIKEATDGVERIELTGDGGGDCDEDAGCVGAA